MPRRESSDIGFLFVVLIGVVALVSFYILYDQEDEPVVTESAGQFTPRQFVPHDRLYLEEVSRSAEREKPKPKPKPKPTPTPTPSPSPEPTKTVNSKPKKQPETTNSSLPPLLLTIREHESGGNYKAYNPTGCIGGCYGAYQLTAEYMDTWAIEAGYPKYAYVGFWPPEIQDAVALYKFNQTGGDLWCDWTDYC